MMYFNRPQFGIQCKQTNIRLLIQRYAQLSILEKGLGVVSSFHFVYDFSRKIFFWLYSITSPPFIVCLPLLREILGNIFNVIAC